MKSKEVKQEKEVKKSDADIFLLPKTIARVRCSGNAPDGHNLTALIWKPIPPRTFDCTIKKVAKAFWLHDKKVARDKFSMCI